MFKCQIEKNIGPLKLSCRVQVEKNRLLAVLGPSGCGKTSLLNLIAGLKRPDGGAVFLDGVVLYDKARGIDQAIHKREIAYIQQGAFLFPHLSVKDNVLYSISKKDRAKYEDRYRHYIQLFNLEGHENEKPAVLSGGQKQRVAIGRALMMSPRLLLWDEPFSALDHRIRKEMQKLVLAVKKDMGIPMIFVTHDLDEAFELADDLAVMEEGRILQCGEKEALLKAPASNRVRQLIGTNIKPSPYVLGVSGYSNTGKTRIMEYLIRALKAEGYKVGTIKHHVGDFEVDKPGKDSYKHRKAGSDRVILASDEKYVTMTEGFAGDKNDPIVLKDLIEAQADMDVVLFEGYKASPYKKIEVVEPGQSEAMACDPKTLIGVVSDASAYEDVLDMVKNQIKEYRGER